MKRTAFLSSLAFLSLLLPAALRAQVPQRPEPQRTVTVGGEGIVRVSPDMATLSFGIVSRAEDPEEARRLNAEASRNALNTVRSLGIPEQKIRVNVLRLDEYHDYNPQTQRHERQGFEAVRMVDVQIEDLEKLPTVVARVVQQGANRLQGIQYDLKDREGPRNEALQAAAQNARQKAGLLASAVGASLGQIVQISEQSYDFPRPMPMYRAEAAMSVSKDVAEPEPAAYASGEIEVRVTVQATFLIQ